MGLEAQLLGDPKDEWMDGSTRMYLTSTPFTSTPVAALDCDVPEREQVYLTELQKYNYMYLTAQR